MSAMRDCGNNLPEAAEWLAAKLAEKDRENERLKAEVAELRKLVPLPPKLSGGRL